MKSTVRKIFTQISDQIVTFQERMAERSAKRADAFVKLNEIFEKTKQAGLEEQDTGVRYKRCLAEVEVPQRCRLLVTGKGAKCEFHKNADDFKVVSDVVGDPRHVYKGSAVQSMVTSIVYSTN